MFSLAKKGKMVMNILYIAMSLDGYIAREGDSVD